MKYAILIALLFFATGAAGQPGRIDTNFGYFPWVSTHFGFVDRLNSIIEQPDGKILAVGSSIVNINDLSQGSKIAVSRYLNNGSLDSSFGTTGKIILNSDNKIHLGKNVLVQKDGKIIVGGLQLTGGMYEFIMLRLFGDGSIDTTFGAKGKAMTFFPPDRSDKGYIMALQPDEKIIVVGNPYKGMYEGDTRYDFLVARYTQNGKPDSSFGTIGYVTTDFAVHQDDHPESIAIQDDGKVVIAGYSQNNASQYYYPPHAVLVRYNNDGSVDPSFGTGRAGLSWDYVSISAIKTLPSGKIVGFGWNTDGVHSHLIFLRYNADGTPDGTLDGAGFLTTNDTDQSLHFFIVTPSGEMLLCGTDTTNGANDFVMKEYNLKGKRVGSFSEDLGNNEYAMSCILQTNGQIVVGGYSNDDFALIRFNADWKIDSSFNNHLEILTSTYPGDDEATCISISPDDRILLGGYSDVLTSTSDDLVAIRNYSNGGVDSTFWTTGKGKMYLSDDMKFTTVNAVLNISPIYGYLAGDIYVPLNRTVEFALLKYTNSNSFELITSTTSDFGFGSNYCQSLLMQPDGKLVLSGYAFTGRNFDFAIERYNSGSVDSTFGINGKVTTDLQINQDYAYASALQADGKIILAGTSFNDVQWKVALVRYNSNGSLDRSFGDTGVVLTAIHDSDDCAKGVQVQNDGKIVVAGYTHDKNKYNVALIRYNINGTLDSTFGKFGIVETAIGSADAKANGMVIQADGKILIAGYASNGKDDDFMLACYYPNGNLDNKFGNSGITTTDYGFGDDHANALALQSDGSIVVAGYAFNGTDKDYAVARYLPDLSLGVIDRKSSQAITTIYPNPIHNTAKLEYELLHAQPVTIKLFDVLGNERATFVSNEIRSEGKNTEEIIFPNGLASGSYYLVVETREGKISVKVIKE